MSDIDERVKNIIIKQLGVKEEEIKNESKFVEDLVRDIAIEFNNDDRIAAYIVESENFESIHNHSAYAMLQLDKDKKVK